MTHRKLVLRRELLSELSDADLTVVVGGASVEASCQCPSASYYCITGYAICSRLICA